MQNISFRCIVGNQRIEVLALRSAFNNTFELRSKNCTPFLLQEIRLSQGENAQTELLQGLSIQGKLQQVLNNIFSITTWHFAQRCHVHM
jgi:hypothetical protein